LLLERRNRMSLFMRPSRCLTGHEREETIESAGLDCVRNARARQVNPGAGAPTPAPGTCQRDNQSGFFNTVLLSGGRVDWHGPTLQILASPFSNALYALRSTRRRKIGGVDDFQFPVATLTSPAFGENQSRKEQP
jgi:hypothetical protein